MVFIVKPFFILSLLLFISGCVPKKPKPAFIVNLPFSQAKLIKRTFKELPGFDKDDLAQAYETFKKSCFALRRTPELQALCTKQITTPKDFFTQNFIPYQLINDDNTTQGTITGYYEPLLYGSYTQNAIYQYPIFKTPHDLVTKYIDPVYPNTQKIIVKGRVENGQLIPYYDRAQITQMNNLEPICFVDDELDLFSLHVQGSGKVQFEDGSIINVGYDDKNGYEYQSIGKYMIKQGYLKKASLQQIKTYLIAHPEQKEEILGVNKSYVFFKKRTKGATGSLGMELVAERSIAVDRKYIPLGYPVFLSTTHPTSKKPLQKMVFAHDTGSAIKGKIRADFFWGYAQKALNNAGIMHHSGEMWILVPREIATN